MLIENYRHSAFAVYYAMSAVTGLANAVMFTTATMYYVQELGLNPLQLVLIGTILELSYFLFEMPTGVLADTYGRRLSVIVAFGVLGAAFVMKGGVPFAFDWFGGWIPLFALALAAEAIRGVGEAFLSGAQTAWIVGEVGESRMGAVFAKGNQLRQLFAAAGILVSVALAEISLMLPFLVGGVLYLCLTGYAALRMPERNFRPSHREEEGAIRTMTTTFAEGVRLVKRKPALWTIMLASFFFGAASEGFDRLWEAQLLTEIGLPELGALGAVGWFGVIALVGMGIGAASNEWFVRRFNMADDSVVEKTVFWTTVCKVVLIACFALSGSLVYALIAVWALGIVNALFYPAYETWVNRNLEDRSRATVLSMFSQSDALGQTFGGPGVGWIGFRWSLRASLLTAAALLLPIVVALRSTKTKT